LTVFQSLVLCHRFRSWKAVDKVYGLLGLIQPDDRIRHQLVPDYTLSPEKLFTKVAQSLLMSFDLKSQMMVLRFAGQRETSEDWAAELRDGNMDDVSRDHLPSWAPNWAIPLEASVLEHRKHEYDYRASLPAVQRMRFSD